MKISHLTLAFGSLLTAVAFGQSSPSLSQFPHATPSPPLVQHHASTAFEGELRGRADGIRALGEFNYNTAAAALIFEEARKANYANELRHAETFWAKRDLHESHRPARKTKSLSQEYSKEERKEVSARLPAPFVAPHHPAFVWPSAFNHPAFGEHRERLAQLFSQRSLSNSGPQSASHFRIQNTTAEMRSLLSDLVRELPPMAYIEGRNFLDRAASEAGLPVQPQIAAR